MKEDLELLEKDLLGQLDESPEIFCSFYNTTTLWCKPKSASNIEKQIVVVLLRGSEYGEKAFSFSLELSQKDPLSKLPSDEKREALSLLWQNVRKDWIVSTIQDVLPDSRCILDLDGEIIGEARFLPDKSLPLEWTWNYSYKGSDGVGRIRYVFLPKPVNYLFGLGPQTQIAFEYKRWLGGELEEDMAVPILLEHLFPKPPIQLFIREGLILHQIRQNEEVINRHNFA